MNVVVEIKAALEMHQTLKSVRLNGSRHRGNPVATPDWDFEAHVTDCPTLARDVPEIVTPLQSLSQMWDAHSGYPCYCFIPRGIGNVDFLFLDHHREIAPPWTVNQKSLAAIDSHF